MELAAEYRRRAEATERLAETAVASDEHRRLIYEMARTWRMMADQREAQRCYRRPR